MKVTAEIDLDNGEIYITVPSDITAVELKNAVQHIISATQCCDAGYSRTDLPYQIVDALQDALEEDNHARHRRR